MNDKQLADKAKVIRRLCIEASARTHSSHLGCALSMADILTFLYYEQMEIGQDKFILSKGHAAIGLYATLFDRGLLSKDDYESYHENGSALIAHPNHLVPGIDVSTGSLGHGPAIATGLAWAKTLDGQPGTIYCLLGDGECQEGTVWEALVFMSRKFCNNLVLIIDVNNYQGYIDSSDSLLSQQVLLNMLKGTGLAVYDIDGHSFADIRKALTTPSDGPRIIFARTIKGKGVSYMEDSFEWHYKSPNPEQLAIALEELK
jgi:transketolase